MNDPWDIDRRPDMPARSVLGSKEWNRIKGREGESYSIISGMIRRRRSKNKCALSYEGIHAWKLPRRSTAERIRGAGVGIEMLSS